jgi:hypothetical protein
MLNQSTWCETDTPEGVAFIQIRVAATEAIGIAENACSRLGI